MGKSNRLIKNAWAKTLFIALLMLFFSGTVALAAYSSYDGSIATFQDFRNGTNNTVGYDVDGKYDRQCWDGVQILYKRLGMSLSTGGQSYAKYCWLNTNARAANTGDQFIQITSIDDVRRGDILVFDQINATYYTGHIGFADENNNPAKSTITVWGQNQEGDGNGYYFTSDEYAKWRFLGAFRYKGWANGILDVNGWLDGDSTAGNVAGYGTFDVYINGSLASNDVTDYYNSALAAGTTYEIKDIRATSGHVYKGVTSGNLSGTISAGSTTDVRLKFLSQYTISYNANGGRGAPASQTKTYGTALTLSSTRPTLTGYTFKGWATSASATSATYQPGGSYTSNVAATLYAVWQANSYTATLNPNGGTVAPTSLSVTYGGYYGNLPEPKRSGYLFDGWYTASSGGSKVATTTKVATASNHTLYAHWREITKLKLPAALTRIEDQAFMGCSTMAVIIPQHCEYIGSEAFANSNSLLYVYFPNADMTIKTNAFSGCPNVTFVCYEDTSAQIFAQGKSIPYILYQSGWVLAETVPAGATVTDEKWTYTRSVTGTTTPTASTTSGWTQTGFTWQKTGSGTHTYANYPAGFNQSHALYSQYAKSALSSSASGNTKREVSAASWKGFIYWHWANTTNRLINNVPGVSDGLDFCQFCAFETTADYGHTAPNGYTDEDCFSTEDYGCAYSWWWWRFDVYQQTYTDYQKLFTYTAEMESTSVVAEGNGISNVKHWVKYSF